MTGEPDRPKFSELRSRYEALGAKRPDAEAALEQVKQDKTTIKERDALICSKSNWLTSKLRDDEDDIALDVFYNVAGDLQGNAERTWGTERLIAKLDQWHQRFVEREEPKLELAERRAEMNLLKIDLDLADTRVLMAQAKLNEDTASIDQQHGGILVHSNLIDALQQDAATASQRYHGAVDAYKEEVERQEKRKRQMASIGLITGRNVSNAIARY
jgi:hypothetical protein